MFELNEIENTTPNWLHLQQNSIVRIEFPRIQFPDIARNCVIAAPHPLHWSWLESDCASTELPKFIHRKLSEMQRERDDIGLY